MQDLFLACDSQWVQVHPAETLRRAGWIVGRAQGANFASEDCGSERLPSAHTPLELQLQSSFDVDWSGRRWSTLRRQNNVSET
uniref:Uncharacterized protein n=1 Tax=Trichuris muris TaxID=70415 RepID=A0A5S6QKY1_TRIMR